MPAPQQTTSSEHSNVLIYVVEDDADIARLVQHQLELNSYCTRVFATGASVVQEAARDLPRLLILDIMLPGMDGFELCWQIRRHPLLAKVPVIFMTAKTAEVDRVRGLDLGADDYISKPFSPRELMARVRAVLRRAQPPPSSPVLKVGELEIDSGSMILRVRNQEVPITTREFRLLEFMARNIGRVFTRDQLLDAVWSDGSFITPRSVDVYVRRLREKIEPEPDQPRYLRTVHGAGYRFEVPKQPTGDF
jgi:two-component system phosphate regulon response regulator PhoB